MKRTDERDVVFSRLSYREGSAAYEDYYRRHPERKTDDDALREAARKGRETRSGFAREDRALVPAIFRLMNLVAGHLDGPVSADVHEGSPEELTARIKKVARFLGADLAGVAKMNPASWYSHRGDPSCYGLPVEEGHPFAVAVACEMSFEMVCTAPRMPQLLEVARVYLEVGLVGAVLAQYLRELGYEARNHMEGNYLVVAPLVARDAGLGQIGRSGLLVTPDFGPRVRLGVVTTTMPLVPDPPLDAKLAELCVLCGNCARTCPGEAISDGPPEGTGAAARWPTHPERCYRMWTKAGTDCGICLSSCPLGDPETRGRLDGLAGDPEGCRRLLDEFHKRHGRRPYSGSTRRSL